MAGNTFLPGLSHYSDVTTAGPAYCLYLSALCSSAVLFGGINMKVKWTEPVEFARAFAQATGAAPTRRKQVWIGVGVGAVVAIIIPAFQLLFYLLHKKDLGVPVWVYFFAPAIAGVFAGFLPSMIATIPATIVLEDKGIHRIKPIGTIITAQLWPWETISALKVEDVTYGQVSFRVLVVCSQNEAGEILIGLGNTPVEQIDDIARQMGKKLEIRS